MIRRGIPVVTLDSLTYSGNTDNLADLAGARGHSFVQGDICDAALLSQLLARHQPRAVVNFAAETHVDRSIDGPAVFIRTNVVGTSTLLEETRRHWCRLPPPRQDAFRFVQVSTDEVYGSVDKGRCREGDPYRPNSPYSASKAAGDHMARAYHRTYGLPTLVTNGSNTYGPRQFPEKLIPLHILNAIEGLPLPVYGDGSNQREWLYVDDHCRGIAAVLESGHPGESYNIGADHEHANIEVVIGVCAVLDRMAPRPDGRPHADSIAFVTDRPGHDFRYALDSGALKQVSDWHPATAFADGLHATVRWYLENEGWWRNRYNRARLGIASLGSL